MALVVCMDEWVFHGDVTVIQNGASPRTHMPNFWPAGRMAPGDEMANERAVSRVTAIWPGGRV